MGYLNSNQEQTIVVLKVSPTSNRGRIPRISAVLMQPRLRAGTEAYGLILVTLRVFGEFLVTASEYTFTNPTGGEQATMRATE